LLSAGPQVIGKAKVPIIKFEEVPSGLNFDVSFDVANGPQSAELVRSMVERLPAIRPLLLVLKIFLQQRDMNEVCQWAHTHQILVSCIISRC
jgi:non-canonical poly(A) RNA polymerase PAPD5/7